MNIFTILTKGAMHAIFVKSFYQFPLPSSLHLCSLSIHYKETGKEGWHAGWLAHTSAFDGWLVIRTLDFSGKLKPLCTEQGGVYWNIQQQWAKPGCSVMLTEWREMNENAVSRVRQGQSCTAR